MRGPGMSIKPLLKEFLGSPAFRRAWRVARARAPLEAEARRRIAAFLRGDAALSEFFGDLAGTAGAHGPIEGADTSALFPLDAPATARFLEALARAAPESRIEAELRRALAGIDTRDPTERLRGFLAFVARVAAEGGEETALPLEPEHAAAFLTFCWHMLYDGEVPAFTPAAQRALLPLAEAGFLAGADKKRAAAPDPADRFAIFLRFARELRDLLARVNPQLGFWAVDAFLEWYLGRAAAGAAAAGTEARAAAAREEAPGPAAFADPIGALARETFLPEPFLRDIVEALESRRQLLLEGPTAVGKTFLARRLAAFVARDPSRVAFLALHPAVRHECVVESAAGPGIVSALAERAAAEPEAAFALILDDAGRVDLRAALGEALVALDDRDAAPLLPFSRRPLCLSRNLRVIATATELSDAAVRRRFATVRLAPDPAVLARFFEARAPDLAWVAKAYARLLRRLLEDGGPAAALGHGALMRPGPLDAGAIERLWRTEIQPFVEAHVRDPARLAGYDLGALRAEAEALWNADPGAVGGKSARAAAANGGRGGAGEGAAVAGEPREGGARPAAIAAP